MRKVKPTGVVTTLAGLAGSTGSANGTNSSARFNFPYKLAVDSVGNVYVSDEHTIRKVTPSGAVTTLAGLAGSPGSEDGAGSDGGVNYPGGEAVGNGGRMHDCERGQQQRPEGNPS